MPEILSRSLLAIALLFAALGAGAGRAAQPELDQANPSVIQEELRRSEAPGPSREVAAPLVPESNVRGSVDTTIVAGAIKIEGASVVPHSAFSEVIDAYVGRRLSPEDLRSLASEVAGVVRSRGYGLATAWIPEQRLTNGVLRVHVDEGRIGEIRADGPAAAVARQFLVGLIDGSPVTTARLERQLLLIGDTSGVWVSRARLERANSQNVLLVSTGYDRTRLYVQVDNWGTDIVGPVRMNLNLDLNGLLAADDRLTMGGAVTPLQPRELGFFHLGYAKGTGDKGSQLRIAGYVARTAAGGEIRHREISGNSHSIELGFSHPLHRSRASSLWLNLDAIYTAADQAEDHERFRSDRTTTVAAGLYGILGRSQDRLRGRVTFRRGLDLFGATQADDRLASRWDADGTFSKVDFWAAYDRKFASGLSFGLQAIGQVADGPLLLSEEMGLGGRYFLRGYDYRELSGDKGIAGSVELRFDLKNPPAGSEQFQLYAFADGGSVGNYRQGYGSGSLASAGAGVRLRLAYDLDVSFEVGVPFSRGASGERPDPRLSFTLSRRF